MSFIIFKKAKPLSSIFIPAMTEILNNCKAVLRELGQAQLFVSYADQTNQCAMTCLFGTVNTCSLYVFLLNIEGDGAGLQI